MNKLYESFHAVTKKHRFIVEDTDYTYRTHIALLKRRIRSKSTILDIGCGTGAIDFYLSSHGHTVTGIDISHKAIASCKENAQLLGQEKNTKFYVSTAEAFKPKQLFDVVLCIEVIEHIKNDAKLLQKILALLKKNGLLVLSTPSLNAPLYRMGLLRRFDKRVGHLRRYKLKELTSLIASSGFKIIEQRKAEGIVRNFVYTSTIGGNIFLRAINRIPLIQYVFEKLDAISLPVFGESDLIIVCQKK